MPIPRPSSPREKKKTKRKAKGERERGKEYCSARERSTGAYGRNSKAVVVVLLSRTKQQRGWEMQLVSSLCVPLVRSSCFLYMRSMIVPLSLSHTHTDRVLVLSITISP